MKKDVTFKCLENNAKCVIMGYNYLLGKECKPDGNDYYTLEDDTTDGLIKCFKTKTDCFAAITDGGGGGVYFNEKLKKCWKNYPNGYYIKYSSQISQTNDIEVIEECEQYYYKESVLVTTPPGASYYRYICTGDCKSATTPELFFDRDKKNCESSCVIFGKYYYDPRMNECLETCIGRDGLEFSDFIDFNIPSTDPAPAPTECKHECDDSSQRYNYGTKICLSGNDCSSVGLYSKYGESKKVCYNSCLDIPGKNNIYESHDNSKICYTKDDIETSPISPGCSFYYKQNDGSMKCIESTSSCYAKGFEFVLDKECLHNCDDYYKLMDETGYPTKKCFKTLTDALDYGGNVIKYYDKTLKKCWINYDPNTFILYDDNGIFEVVEDCEKYYYEKDSIFYCTNNCKDENLYFIPNIPKCETTCSNFMKSYYNPTNNECLDTCSGLNDLIYSNQVVPGIPEECRNKCENYFITKSVGTNTIYECVDTCPPISGSTFNLIELKTKECLIDCSPTNHYEVESTFCYPRCDVGNGFIYINTDNYECVKACPTTLKKIELLLTISDGSSNNGKKIYLCKSACEPTQFRLGEECIEKCPSDYNYIGHNKICKENCNTDPNGQHYYPINEGEILNPDYYPIYQCIDSCEETPSSSYPFYTEIKPNECLSSCPSLIPYYISSDPHKCLTKCPTDFPFFYSTDPNPTLCINVNKCPYPTSDLHYYSEGACYDSCNDVHMPYISSNGTCSPKCPTNEIKKKNLDGSGNHDGTYTCLRNCEEFIYRENIEDDPECMTDCPKNMNYIGKDNVCKTSCGNIDGTFYYEYKEITGDTPSDSYKIIKCVDGCKDDYKYKEINNGNQCHKQCPSTHYLSEEENICYDICSKSDSYPFSLQIEDSSGTPGAKICWTQCINDPTNINIYYGDNKVCIKDCTVLADTKIVDHDNKCVEKCNKLSLYPFELNGKCVDRCEITAISPALPKKRYSITDYICKEKCGENEYLIEDNKCDTTCNYFVNDVEESGILTGEKECIPSCKSIDKFYYSINNICLSQCNNNDKVVEDTNLCVSDCNELTDKKYFLYKSSGPGDPFKPYDMCVLTCPINKEYILNDECVNICPESSGIKYFQKEFIHGETEMHKICLNDCPTNYPYYTITPDLLGNLYGCQAGCEGYVVPNEDTLINAKLCLDTCPEGDYKYKIESLRYCYKDCPTEAKFHFSVSSPPSASDDNNC